MNIYIYMYICICIFHIYIFIYIYTHMYVCISVSMCVLGILIWIFRMKNISYNVLSVIASREEADNGRILWTPNRAVMTMRICINKLESCLEDIVQHNTITHLLESPGARVC
jgi:hypothetical protein